TITGTGLLAGGGYVVNDAQEKAELRTDRAFGRTTLAAASTANWYDTFASSVGEGVLQKNTMFPLKAVNGYIYFPRFADIPESGNRIISNTTREQDEYLQAVQRVMNKSSTSEFVVRVVLPTDSLSVRFRPVID